MTDRGGGALLLSYTPAGVTGSDDDDLHVHIHYCAGNVCTHRISPDCGSSVVLVEG